MNVVVGSPELFGGRFTPIRRIGEGGFGVVYEAIDTKFGGRIAIKVLRPDRAAAATRFKREFRSLVDVQHANLVRLFELASHDDTLFFSMELVEGVDFLEHVSNEKSDARNTEEWPAPRPTSPRVISVEKLRSALVQLVEAVQALHDARKLHCDVKPTNVLVDSDGRLVLLDFGLVANLDDAVRGTLGTPGYMAPEQLGGATLTEATDWYGVGAMLHEVVTGAMPSHGKRCETADPELRVFADLCNELLEVDPGRRANGDKVLERLGVSGGRSSRSRTRLFGRRTEIDRLRARWETVVRDGGSQLVRVVGGSGIGKTALVEHVVSELRREGAWVLPSRCYEQESVPYKALDGAVDALADELGREGSVVAPPSVLARVFPVLRSIVRSDGDVKDVESQTARHLAFEALRQLLLEVSARRPLAIFLDDVQWGDVDSARLLAELVRPPNAPRMLVITAYRPQGDSHGFLAALDEQPMGIEQEVFELDELPPDIAREMATHLVGAGKNSATIVDRIDREAAGNPLFIQQLASATHHPEAGAIGLREVILGRLERLDDSARRLVHMIALAAGPIDERVAIAAASIEGADVPAAIRAVRQARLVSGRGSANGVLLEPLHDRVRETIAGSLSDDIARSSHLRIADTLLGFPHPDPDALVHHLRHGGDRARTATYALLAAERAETALAFERAAHHLELALEVGASAGDDRSRLLERRAEALANAGRGGDAAEAFEDAAELASVREREQVLRRRAGELTLRSGRIELGQQRMERVLRDVGVRPPKGRRSAAALSVVRRLRLFAHGVKPRVRPPTSDASAKARLEALWSASTGLSMVNHVVADALGLQHMLEAIAQGDRSHLVRGLGYEAAFEAVIGGKFLRARCARILDAMDALAAESAEPYDRAWAQMSKGVTSWFLGDWPSSWRNCDEAATIYREQCRGVAWELAICDAYRLPALAYLGELRELSRLVPRASVGARERADLYAVNLLRQGQQSMTFLVDDRPDVALEEARIAIEPFPARPYLLPHYHHLFAVAQAELYRGNFDVVLPAIEAAWKGLESARLLMVQCLRCEIRHLRARAAIALASNPGSDRAALHRIARAEAATIERDNVAPAAPFAAAIRAALTDDPAERERQLDSALAGFEAAHMMLYAHASRDRLGALRGGTDGTSARATAAAWFASQQIRDPARMVAMLLPGT